MAGDGIAVDEKDLLALPHLQCRAQVDRDGGLADSALGVEDDNDLAAIGAVTARAVVHDRHGAFQTGDVVTAHHRQIRRPVGGHALHSDEHRLDSPPQRLG